MTSVYMKACAERAKEIAIRTLARDYDPLLACRELAHLRRGLPSTTEDVMLIFAGVDSEVDDLPLGSERERWAVEALRLKDIEAADYREEVRGTVERALHELLVLLG